jgi:DNA-binding SARP family transcriptional activator
MKVYAGLGNKSAVLNQFDKCRKTLLKDIGTEPSDQTIALYESLINE